MQVIEEEQTRLLTLVRESLNTMCRSCLHYNKSISIEGLIAVTVDSSKVILIPLNESTSKTTATPQHHSKQNNSTNRKSAVRKNFASKINYYSDIEDLENIADNSAAILGLISNQPSPENRYFISPSSHQQVGQFSSSASASSSYPLTGSSSFTHHSTGATTTAAFNATPLASSSCASVSVQKQLSSGLTPLLPKPPNHASSSSSSSAGHQQTPSSLATPPPHHHHHQLQQQQPHQQSSSSTTTTTTSTVPNCALTNDSDKGKRFAPILFSCKSESNSPNLIKKVPQNFTKNLVNTIAKCVMKESGCFVTSRVLSRGYASYHKSQDIITGMQSVCKAMDDPHHIGFFRLVNDRTKVFYKCPPDLISSAALQYFGMTLAQYTERFNMPPRPNKSMRNERWLPYITSMRQLSPYYNPGGRTDFLMAKVIWDDRNPTTSHEKELIISQVKPLPEVQKELMLSPGCFVNLEMNEDNSEKINQMEFMSQTKKNDPNHFGQFVTISSKINIFFKVPPSLISVAALSTIDQTLEQYEFAYRYTPVGDADLSPKILSRWPYDYCDIPWVAFAFTQEVVSQIESSLGIMCANDMEILDSSSRKKIKKDSDIIDNFSILQCASSNAAISLPFDLDLSSPIIHHLTSEKDDLDDELDDSAVAAGETFMEDDPMVDQRDDATDTLCATEIKKEFCPC